MLSATEPFHAPSEIYEHLVDGNEQACRELFDHLRVDEGFSVLALCEALTQAFHKVGEAWECSELTVYREHIASQIGYRLLLDFRSLISPPEDDAPVAIGCTPESDPYTLPTNMVELVLGTLGFRAQSLGTNLPLELLAPAMDDVRPRLCWVSVSHVESMSRLREQLSWLSEIGRDRGIKIICGGRAVADELKHGLGGITFLTQLSELEEHADIGF